MKWDDWRPAKRSLMKGFELWREGRLEDALYFFERGVTDNDQDPDPWRGCGSVLWSLERFEEAASAFQRTVELDCWNPMHWHNLGLTYRDLHKLDAARQILQVAVAIDPEYEPAVNEWANVLVDQGRLQEALTLYDRALELDGSRAVVYHNRGVCLRLLGDFEGAMASFSAALRIEPDYRHTLLELRGDWAKPFAIF
jgi:tetratricopeptide (TPR) repeat protein